jgi:hypothetical protein
MPSGEPARSDYVPSARPRNCWRRCQRQKAEAIRSQITAVAVILLKRSAITMRDGGGGMTSYIIALARYREAERVMARAERMLDRMIEHGVEETRAYTVAGVNLTDRRCIRAYQEMRRARERLG